MFKIVIDSEQFQGKRLLQQHRMVNEVVVYYWQGKGSGQIVKWSHFCMVGDHISGVQVSIWVSPDRLSLDTYVCLFLRHSGSML